MTKAQRKLVNLLLQPMVQLRLGLLNVVISIVFLALIGAYVYTRMEQFADVVATLTEADDEVATLLGSYLGNVGWVTLAAGLAFIAVNLLASIYMTHKLVGPTVAFRRHIKALRDGNFGVKTRLRKGDAFVEVAEELNELSDALKDRLKG